MSYDTLFLNDKTMYSFVGACILNVIEVALGPDRLEFFEERWCRTQKLNLFDLTPLQTCKWTFLADL